MKSIWEQLADQCIHGTNYYCDLPWAHLIGEGFILGSEVGDGKLGGILRPFHSSQTGIGSFYDDVQDDDLSPLTIIDPGYSSGYDDHPPGDVKLGQAFISYIYRILASNPEVWKKTMFVITYDEHGSFYDHVVPPGNVPGSPQSRDAAPAFRQLGMRVPSLVIGPYVKKGHVSHALYDHCSILNTITRRFDLTAGGRPWLNDRVMLANDLSDCIDHGLDAPRAPVPDIPVLEFSESELMDFARGPFPDGQQGLADMVERGEMPEELDLRRERARHMHEFIALGEKLGAIRLTR